MKSKDIFTFRDAEKQAEPAGLSIVEKATGPA